MAIRIPNLTWLRTFEAAARHNGKQARRREVEQFRAWLQAIVPAIG